MVNWWTTRRGIALTAWSAIVFAALGCSDDSECSDACSDPQGSSGKGGTAPTGGSSNTGGTNTGGSTTGGSGGTGGSAPTGGSSGSGGSGGGATDVCGGCAANELCIFQAGGPGPGRNLCASNPICRGVGECGCIQDQGDCLAVPGSIPLCQCDNGLE